ncbi:helix-turn-helix domain-containing protein [Harryflintia acetispora]|uniref:Transcriptional regulator with XRE-family HTH domain n=1 Tax=Harryflintia acetispora TaxID=1849041 RepID=A0A9X8Y8P9_9FIRM|nr:helix-turn-helix transcriptional regulator [Harryflintia acetispora]TCL44457.1 transcriptional regulator with XRE-family HTH domain [Harryflintia acetispora]
MKQKSTAISDTQSEKIAIRLKALREEKGVSHETLSKATGISKDALIKYEKAVQPHSSFGANRGMSIDFAVALARYYDVSTDYLLCNTDIRSPDTTVGDICTKTGLSEAAIYSLVNLKKMRLQELNSDRSLYSNDGNTAIYRMMNALNALLEKDNGNDILGCIGDYLYNTHIDGYEEDSDGIRRILPAEELNDTDLYLKIMPRIKVFQKELEQETAKESGKNG